jgi:hypothetical protein
MQTSFILILRSGKILACSAKLNPNYSITNNKESESCPLLNNRFNTISSEVYQDGPALFEKKKLNEEYSWILFKVLQKIGVLTNIFGSSKCF